MADGVLLRGSKASGEDWDSWNGSGNASRTDWNGSSNGTTKTNRTEWDVQQALVPTLDVLIMVTGLVGHSLVVSILAGRRRRGSRLARGTDALLLALSAADLLLLLCLPFQTAAIALGRWPFGSFLCKAVSFLGVACNAASAFTLAALAVTRYVTVVHPAWSYRSRVHRWLPVAAASLWLPALTLAAPQFAFRKLGASTTLHCFAFLSDLSQLVYSTALFLFAFVLPLAAIVLMYAKIYGFLRRTRRQGRVPQLERYQRQVTQTSALLVLVFTLCWLPSYALMFSLVGNTEAGRPGYHSLGIFVRLLACSSTVLNLVLYAFMSRKFRRELLALGRRAHCSLCPESGRDAVQPFNPVELETPPLPPRRLCY